MVDVAAQMRKATDALQRELGAQQAVAAETAYGHEARVVRPGKPAGAAASHSPSPLPPHNAALDGGVRGHCVTLCDQLAAEPSSEVVVCGDGLLALAYSQLRSSAGLVRGEPAGLVLLGESPKLLVRSENA